METISAARIRASSLDPLLKSELIRAIDEANLGAENAVIAKRYLIEKIPQVDIAAEIGYERSTISRRIPKIISRVEWAANKLGYL